MKYLLSLALLCATGIAPSHAAPGLKDAKRIVILGDSITYAGDWVTDLDAWLGSQGATAEVINLGLSSETATDLTPTEQQETHISKYGFPRPTISERIGRILEKTKPDWVMACYGMNDGSSLPQNDEGFARFCKGMETLKSQMEKTGVKRVVFLTPPVQDAGPAKPPSKHDEMLTRFSEWLIGQRKTGWEVVDLHGPMRAVLDEKRMTEPNFRFSGDGVHPNREGHDLMAKQVITYLSSASETTTFFTSSPYLQAPLRDLFKQRMEVRRNAWLTFTGHTRPGVAKGLPMAEADVRIAELTAKIQAQEIAAQKVK